MKVGDSVRWVKEDLYIGPPRLNYITIRRNDIRKVIAISEDNTKIVVTNKDGRGMFGWVDVNNFELVKE